MGFNDGGAYMMGVGGGYSGTGMFMNYNRSGGEDLRMPKRGYRNNDYNQKTR